MSDLKFIKGKVYYYCVKKEEKGHTKKKYGSVRIVTIFFYNFVFMPTTKWSQLENCVVSRCEPLRVSGEHRRFPDVVQA